MYTNRFPTDWYTSGDDLACAMPRDPALVARAASGLAHAADLAATMTYDALRRLRSWSLRNDLDEATHTRYDHRRNFMAQLITGQRLMMSGPVLHIGVSWALFRAKLIDVGDGYVHCHELCDQALDLDPVSRVELAELLLQSIEVESSDVRQAWIDEVARRRSETQVAFVSYDDVFRA